MQPCRKHLVTVAFGDFRRVAAKTLDNRERPIGFATRQIGVHVGMVGGSIHLDAALWRDDANPLQRKNQRFCLCGACCLHRAGKGVNAHISPFAKVGEHPVALRPETVDAGLPAQPL